MNVLTSMPTKRWMSSTAKRGQRSKRSLPASARPITTTERRQQVRDDCRRAGGCLHGERREDHAASRIRDGAFPPRAESAEPSSSTTARQDRAVEQRGTVETEKESRLGGNVGLEAPAGAHV